MLRVYNCYRQNTKEVIVITIYKITNIHNGKVYIGQTTGNIKTRFARHLNDAESGRLETHLAKAIRHYGRSAFKCEIIDEAYTKEELDDKERFWISFYQSNNREYGYNLTHGGEDTNTYTFKTKNEMDEIRKKISVSKTGANNPCAKGVKCMNTKTGEEFHFSTVNDMRLFFNERGHAFISSRCNGRNTYLYKGVWAISYENEPYNSEYSSEKHNRKSKRICMKNIENNDSFNFCSYAQAERFLGLRPKAISGKTTKKKSPFIFHNYLITVID